MGHLKTKLGCCQFVSAIGGEIRVIIRAISERHMYICVQPLLEITRQLSDRQCRAKMKIKIKNTKKKNTELITIDDQLADKPGKELMKLLIRSINK